MLNLRIGFKFGIDIGHENIRIYSHPGGVVFSSPSYAATNGKKFFKGEFAKSILGKGPKDIKVIPLIDDNSIRDYKVLFRYLKEALNESRPIRFPHTLLVAKLESLKGVDVKFLFRILKQLGFWHVYFVPQILATAVGLDLDITKPRGYMIVDIGAGTTKIGIISLYGISVFREINIAGRDMDRRIAEVLAREAQLIIGQRTAEELKKRALDLGYLLDPMYEEEYIEVKGMDAFNKLPQVREIPRSLIARAVEPSVMAIIEEVKLALSETSDESSSELNSDIIDYGIYLTGGCSFIPNIDTFMQEKLRIKINNTRTNLATIKGLGKIISTKLFNEISNLKDGKQLFQKISL